MAGDWIKMRSALLSNPKVHTIARLVGECREASRVLTTGASCPPCEVLSRNALRNVTVTALLLVWSSANEHTSDGVMRCCDLLDIDEIAGIPGFGEAMEYVGWALHDAEKDAIILPNFTEWNTPAKDRTAAERQRRYREKRNGNVTRDSNGREEERREEKKEDKTPLPPLDVPAELQDICRDWLTYKRERREAYKPRGEASFAQQVCDLAATEGVAEVKRRLQHAMASNYQGWNFEPKAGTGNGKPASKPVTFAQQAQANMAAIISKAAAADAAAGRLTGQQALLEGYSE